MRRKCMAVAIMSLMLGAAPLAKAQMLERNTAEGVSTVMVGDMEVVAIQDMPGEMSAGLFSGPAPAAEKDRLMPGGKAPSSINCFLIRSGGKNILVDAGWGDNGPGNGQLFKRLAALGAPPETIDVVLLTHMHPDHIGGLFTDGKKNFPHAKILSSTMEYDYWIKEAKGGQGRVAPGKVKELYGDALRTFAFDSEPVPGVTALNAVGHTPGHTAFMLTSGNERLLIIADLLHAAALQFPYPEECPSYDMDTTKAVETRKHFLTMAAREGLPVAGMHIPFSGMGYVKEEGNGYVFTPLQQQ